MLPAKGFKIIPLKLLLYLVKSFHAGIYRGITQLVSFVIQSVLESLPKHGQPLMMDYLNTKVGCSTQGLEMGKAKNPLAKMGRASLICPF